MKLNGLRSKFTRRRLIQGMGAFAFVYGSVALFFKFTQVELILRPRGDMPSDPTRRGMPHVNVELPLHRDGKETGQQLHAFWVPAADSDAPIILYLHGQDATRGKNLEHTESLHECGYHVLVLDYRGYAESFGKESPSESKVYEDALVAFKYLRDEYPSNPIFIYGHSLGGAVAIELATRKEAEIAAGLIVESTFTSISEMSALRFGGLLRLLPIDFLLTERFDSLSKVALIKCPVHFIHGKEDSKVPCRMSQELFKKAKGPATIHLVEGANHADCCQIDKVEYRKRIREFVSNCLASAQQSPSPISAN